MDLVDLHRPAGADDVSKTRLAEFPALKRLSHNRRGPHAGRYTLPFRVVLVGEHGRYPRNEKGRRGTRATSSSLIVQVYQDSVAPCRCSMTSTLVELGAKEMHDTSRRMGLAMMAGSSPPVTWRTPSIEMPLGAKIRKHCASLRRRRQYDFMASRRCRAWWNAAGRRRASWVQAHARRVLEGLCGRRLADSSRPRAEGSHTLKPGAGINWRSCPERDATLVRIRSRTLG
jgi:hypothetical protein